MVGVASLVALMLSMLTLTGTAVLLVVRFVPSAG
jgi:hypothetical protein